MEGIDRVPAAYKITDLFNVDFDSETNLFSSRDDYNKELMLFSEKIRNHLQMNPDDLDNTEKICKVFDQLHRNYSLDYAAAKKLSEKLLKKLFL